MEIKKRSEILKAVIANTKESVEVVNVERVLRKDKEFINTELLKITSSLNKISDAIEDYLANPKLSIDNQLVGLFRDKKILESEMEILKELEKLV